MGHMCLLKPLLLTQLTGLKSNNLTFLLHKEGQIMLLI